MLKKKTHKRKFSHIFWAVFSGRWWTQACDQSSVLLTSPSGSPPNKVRGVHTTSNAHALCGTAGRRQVALYMASALHVATLPVVWDQFFSASVLLLAPQVCFLSTSRIHMTANRLYGVSSWSVLLLSSLENAFSRQAWLSPDPEKISHSLQRRPQLCQSRLRFLPHITRIAGDTADLLQRCWPVRSPKLQRNWSLALPFQPSHPSL